jgi:hypothetical protein
MKCVTCGNGIPNCECADQAIEKLEEAQKRIALLEYTVERLRLDVVLVFSELLFAVRYLRQYYYSKGDQNIIDHFERVVSIKPEGYPETLGDAD